MGIYIIYGRKIDSRKWMIQSVRFKKDKYSLSEAKNWMKRHSKIKKFEQNQKENPPYHRTTILMHGSKGGKGKFYGDYNMRVYNVGIIKTRPSADKSIFLYRGSKFLDVKSKTNWAENPQDAFEYRMNRHPNPHVNWDKETHTPDFSMHEVELFYNQDDILDLTKLNLTNSEGERKLFDCIKKRWPKNNWEDLHDARKDSRVDFGDNWPYSLWENDSKLAKIIRESGYRIIRFLDDFPEGCKTWTFMEDNDDIWENANLDNTIFELWPDWFMKN